MHTPLFCFMRISNSIFLFFIIFFAVFCNSACPIMQNFISIIDYCHNLWYTKK